MWLTSGWHEHASGLPTDSALHHCMFGVERAKKTRIKHVVPAFSQLDVLCDGQREHSEWGLNKATAEGTAYPVQLCKTMPSLFLEQVQRRGAIMPNQSRVFA